MRFAFIKPLGNFIKPLRKLLRWQIASWIIATLIGLWLKLFQLHRAITSYLSYLSIAMWMALAIGSWFTSQTLRNYRPTKKQLAGIKRKRFIRKFRIVQFVPLVLIVALGAFAGYLTLSEQRFYELSQFKGVLFPGDEPDPPTTCKDDTRTALKVFLGNTVLFFEGKRLGIIKVPADPKKDNDPTLLGLDRATDGSIALHAHIVGKNGKVIIDIDRNHFEVNRNGILDSLSPPRTNKSTIMLKDEDGNTLKIQLLNARSMLFSGKIYTAPGEWVSIDEKGLRIMPEGGGLYGQPCVLFSDPEGDVGLFEVRPGGTQKPMKARLA